MTIINVIEVEDGITVSLTSFAKTKIKEAEALFKRIGKRIEEDLDEEDLQDGVENGYIESESENKAVCITWSELNE